ncbi:putative Calnexin like protein [Blattamonas nauphoetae]|uniref:Calnexin like protein n=1 Tax=Blattamonas nauphoetae TaxID=2049346 RepID=A0ABQ9YL49_9EUKA|nr:putative Calnexin like protein [Blattamonas nauphoetae]
MFVFLSLLAELHSTIYFREEFDLSWKKRWVQGHFYEAERKQGTWGYESPLVYANPSAARGVITKGDMRNFQLTADIGQTISTRDKPFILSYTLMLFPDLIRSTTASIKLYPEGIDINNVTLDTPHLFEFGPQIEKRQAHTQIKFVRGKQEYNMIKRYPCKNDKNTHLYTFILYPDHTFEFHIDDYLETQGKIEDYWKCFVPRDFEIPEATKPKDWVDDEFIPDLTDKKPDDWDQPPTIPDPTSKQPDDWNEETDGEWIPCEISNPRHRGIWKPRMLPNPDYKGEWIAPRKVNPAWEEEAHEYEIDNIRYVGINTYQRTAGTLFDNIFIGDDINEYRAFIQTTWYPQYRKEIEGTGIDELEEELDLMDIELDEDEEPEMEEDEEDDEEKKKRRFKEDAERRKREREEDREYSRSMRKKQYDFPDYEEEDDDDDRDL